MCWVYAHTIHCATCCNDGADRVVGRAYGSSTVYENRQVGSDFFFLGHTNLTRTPNLFLPTSSSLSYPSLSASASPPAASCYCRRHHRLLHGHRHWSCWCVFSLRWFGVSTNKYHSQTCTFLTGSAKRAITRWMPSEGMGEEVCGSNMGQRLGEILVALCSG